MGDHKTSLSLQDALTMQLDEMELLETAYPEVTFDTPDTRPLLREVLDDSLKRKDVPDQRCEERRLQTALASSPLLSFRCPLPLKEAQLRVRLPRRYPENPLIATVEGTPRVKASARETIVSVAEAEAIRLSGELRGEPHCIQVLGEAMRASVDLADCEFGGVGAPSDAAAATAGAAEYCSDKSCGGGSSGGGEDVSVGSRSLGKGGTATCTIGPRAVEPEGRSVFLGRRLIYSHHIIATQKRTGIIKTARELGLGGFSKVGWPGVIVIEGEEISCEDFVCTLRGWRWKHLAVRGEETTRVPDGRTLDQERLLPLPLEELGEKDGVSSLAKRCREAGLSELFSTLLR